MLQGPLTPHNHSAAWEALEVPQGLGTTCSRYKWRQSQSHVEVSVVLPATISAQQVGCCGGYAKGSAGSSACR